MSALPWIIGTVVVGGIAYAVTRPSTAAATPGQQPALPRPTSQPAPAVTCPVDPASAVKWGVSKNLVVVMHTAASPPTLSWLRGYQMVDRVAQAAAAAGIPLPISFDRVVLVTTDGLFWRYDANGNPVAAPDLSAAYCEAQTTTVLQLKGPPSFWLPRT